MSGYFPLHPSGSQFAQELLESIYIVSRLCPDTLNYFEILSQMPFVFCLLCLNFHPLSFCFHLFCSVLPMLLSFSPLSKNSLFPFPFFLQIRKTLSEIAQVAVSRASKCILMCELPQLMEVRISRRSMETTRPPLISFLSTPSTFNHLCLGSLLTDSVALL